jgi:DtxR family transcriptional regulator, Mn-dependent transcriptional regulator
MALTEAIEEYVEKLFWFQEAGIEATQANLARAMQVSQPSVTEMVRRLIDEGLVERDERKRLQFTTEGEKVAKHIVSRHRLIEAYLVSEFGIPWDEVHEEAHSFEHGISENLEERMRALLVGVTTCPHGHPIGDAPREPGVPLVTDPVGSTVRVLRHENEAEELLHAFKLAGIEPGDSIEVTGLTGESIELQTPAKGATALSIPESRAVTVAVEVRGEGPIAELDVPGAAVALHTSWGR